MQRTAVACLAFWLVSALFLGIGALAASPSAGEAEAGFVGRIGDERATAGLTGYAVAPDLVEVARRHAEEMRRQQRLHHNPSLGEDVQGWQAVGENVGVGPTVEAIHQKLMESPSHRDNILSGKFTEVGVGVVVDGADLWVVQVFRLPQSAAAPATAEPAPPSSSGEANPAPEPAPEPRPAPAPSPDPSAGSGGVRAATSTGRTAPTAPATSTPAPPTTGAPSSSLATTPPEVPTSLVEPAAAPAAPAATVRSAVATGATRAGQPAPSVDLRGAPGDVRSVTWPVAVAATMLLGVVVGLFVHVGGARVRELADANRPTSLLDVWELALAR